MRLALPEPSQLTPEELVFFNNMNDKTNLFLGYFGLADDPNRRNGLRTVVPILGGFKSTDDEHPLSAVYRVGVPALVPDVDEILEGSLLGFGYFTTTSPRPGILAHPSTREVYVDSDTYFDFMSQNPYPGTSSLLNPFERLIRHKLR